MTILEYFLTGIKIMGNHSKIYFSLLETRKTLCSFIITASTCNYEPLWNPAMIDAPISLFLSRCQLSGLIQQFWQYGETKAKLKPYKLVDKIIDSFINLDQDL